ncbi:transketolase, pyrimidine binding domain-containing protein [Ditylenchus destructor]|nr:transketolase, pyrimidine binding domain-containing protein [Ditylenchus destructor]
METNMLKVSDAICMAMDEEMARDEDVFLLGEEVGYAGGKNATSVGLLKKYSDKRVIDSPISEMGFTGMCVGAAFFGLRPICEFMTFNFAMQGIEQIINNASKTFYMSAGRINVPVVFRGPNGFNEGVAAQHTQDFSAWYAQCPGLKVVAPYSSEDHKGLLKSAIRDDNPVIFLENEMLYTESFPMSSEALSPDFTIPIGQAKIEREGEHLTLVSFSYGMKLALEAADKLAAENINVEVINLLSLRPLDFDCVRKSAIKTGRVVTVEGGHHYAGIGAEIAAQIMESDAFVHLRAPVLRVARVDVPTPYAENLEKLSFPDVDHVVNAAKRALTWKVKGGTMIESNEEDSINNAF